MMLQYLLVLLAVGYSAATVCMTNDCVQEISKLKDEVCYPYRRMVPRPRLFTRCSDAYTRSVLEVCFDACEENYSSGTTVASKGMSFCEEWAHGHPKAVYDACFDPYMIAGKAALKYAQEGAQVNLPPSTTPTVASST